MMIVRTAHRGDLPSLLALAAKAGPGLTSLKPDAGMLASRLDRVERTLSDAATPAEQGYLFVLEDTATGEVAGTCGIEVAIGLDQPSYTYRRGVTVHASRELGVWTKLETLYLSNDLTGYSELCTLFLDPAFRRDRNGALLSKSRFMFLAQFADRFPAHLCAEMRGWFDETGASPFWEALGRQFFQIPFDQADHLTAQGKKAFVAELMPKHPVYVDFLPAAAQAAIGRVHADTVPARAMLEQEGLRCERHVDIFDGGPVLEAYISDLRVSRESCVLPVTIDDAAHAAMAAGAIPTLVSHGGLHDFRVALVPVRHGEASVTLTAAVAAALRVGPGDTVRVLPLSPKTVRGNAS
ncbi:Arginine N-succinyltransferase [Pandoraea terrae]|uniref:Arginine N-succinyltransferase n=1 Tax=Pandoraea terrae TaxID=1537710 RepID=A0A5E4S194_9BURK|nr:arginine N-succinyltransferase [Pandoraea terrae]VVD67878.1 Arginine N-succinyltransferase [Pandoraea terrae]